MAHFEAQPSEKKSAPRKFLIFSEKRFSYISGKWNSRNSGKGTFQRKVEKEKPTPGKSKFLNIYFSSKESFSSISGNRNSEEFLIFY